MSYRAFFGLAKEPFIADLPLDSVLTTPELLGVQQRLDYTLRLGAICLVTGEVGAGKSTALRWSCGQLHPSRYKVLWITASAGSILEVYRQLLAELDLATAEASLLRFDVFAELHTITQFDGDSKPWLPMVLAGQNNLAENLLHRTAIPLASRIVSRSHLPAVDRQGMLDYLNHHLRIAGLKNSPFTEQAVTAVHQGSGGLFRKANHLARGALIAAAAEKSQEVSAEHVRLADSELF
jgi:type II secretory pathway predicted ATPase ExeA